MLRNFGLTIASRVVGAIGQALFLILMARFLGPAGSGVVVAVLAALMFLMTTVDWGMSTRALRLSGDRHSRSYLGFSLAVRLTITILVVLIAISLLSSAFSSAGLLIAAVLYATGESNGEMSINILQGRGRSATAASVLIVRRASLFAPLMLSFDASGLLGGMALNGLVGLTALAFAMWRHVSRPMRIKKVLRENSPFALAVGSAYIQQLDTAAVVSFLGSAAAGPYGLATRLNSPLNMLLGALIQVYIPHIALEADPVKRLTTFRRVRRYVAIIAVGIAALALLAPVITPFLFGIQFAESWPMVAAAFLGAGISGVAQVHLAWFFGTRTPIGLSVTLIVIASGSLVSVCVLGAVWGVWGMALSYVLAQIAVAVAIGLRWRSSSQGS